MELVSCTFKEIIQVLTRNIFEDKNKKRRGFESTVKGNDIWMNREGLMEVGLRKM